MCATVLAEGMTVVHVVPSVAFAIRTAPWLYQPPVQQSSLSTPLCCRFLRHAVVCKATNVSKRIVAGANLVLNSWAAKL